MPLVHVVEPAARPALDALEDVLRVEHRGDGALLVEPAARADAAAQDEPVPALREVDRLPAARDREPARDLLDRDIFVDAALGARAALIAMTGTTPLLFGCISRNERWCGKPLHNAGSMVANVSRYLEGA